MISLTFTGRIGKDAETRRIQSGKSVTSFSVATDLGWGDNKKTLWIDCSIWEERGEKLAPYLTKGTPVTISGRPDVRAYDKNGPQAQMQCTVNEIELQGGKDTTTSSNTGGGETYEIGSGNETDAMKALGDSSEIPF